jgi:hypothetical protein
VRSIADHEVLWRRVESALMQPDGTPQSNAFKTLELSVHRAGLTTLAQIARAYPGVAIYAFTAGQVRALGGDVEEEPTPQDPSHAIVRGVTSSGNARRLRNMARRIA